MESSGRLRWLRWGLAAAAVASLLAGARPVAWAACPDGASYPVGAWVDGQPPPHADRCVLVPVLSGGLAERLGDLALSGDGGLAALASALRGRDRSSPVSEYRQAPSGRWPR